VREKLFGNGDPIGESIRLKQISCRVIGVLEIKGASSFGTDQDDIGPDPDPDLPCGGYRRQPGRLDDLCLDQATAFPRRRARPTSKA
jgi:ABC-type antimicrobial peptide transport system permease subunit